MQLAVDTVNANGGVDGKKIDLIVQDDKSQPSEAITVARSLITSDHVSAIFGASSGSSTLAFLPVATAAKVPVLAPNSTVAVVAQFPQGAYRTTPSDTVVVDGVVKYLKEHHLTSVGLLTESAAFGAQAGDAIAKQAPAAGIKVVDREVYDPTATDLTAELTKIRAAKPQIVVVWGTGPAPSVAFKNMRELGMSDLPRLAPLGVATESNIKLADGAMDGVLIPGVIDAQKPANSAEKQFVSAFQKKYKALPTTLDAIAWDPAFLLQQAGKTAKSTDSTKLQAALNSLCNFDGVVGSYCYKKSHDGLSVDAITMVQVKGTDFVSVTAP
jgi:branched-chain amino acid transport system substrate-binding protein